MIVFMGSGSYLIIVGGRHNATHPNHAGVQYAIALVGTRSGSVLLCIPESLSGCHHCSLHAIDPQ